MRRIAHSCEVPSGTRLARIMLICFFVLCPLLLSPLLIQCRGEKPKGLTSHEEDLLVRTTAALSLASQEYAGDPEGLTARQDSIFSSLGLSREDYQRLVEKMGQRPERWLEVWERIAKRIEASSGEPSAKP